MTRFWSASEALADISSLVQKSIDTPEGQLERVGQICEGSIGRVQWLYRASYLGAEP